MNWKKYNVPGWHGRKDYIKLNTKAIYVPQWTLITIFKDIKKVDIWYDPEQKAISLNPSEEGVAIANYGKHGAIGTSLSRVMPKGWYVYLQDQKSDKENIFILGKEEDVLRAPLKK